MHLVCWSVLNSSSVCVTHLLKLITVYILLGWATAELVMTKLLPLWVGARGIEFDWKYMQMSFDANIALVSITYKNLSGVDNSIIERAHIHNYIHVLRN